MPRPPRADVAGEIYHVLNRGNCRQQVFHKDADYEAFERVLVEGLRKYPVSLYAYCWMPNHWHMVVSPREDGAMSGLMYWVTMTHTARHHAHYHQTGYGHLYQGRYKSFPVQSDEHFFVVSRYVERNALNGKLCQRAETGGLEAFTTGETVVRACPRFVLGRSLVCQAGLIESTAKSTTTKRNSCSAQSTEASHSVTQDGSRQRLENTILSRLFANAVALANSPKPLNRLPTVY